MPARLITPAAAEPVSIDEAKKQLRLETPLDDGEVTRLIIAARQYVEQICWRGLLEQTWELVGDGFNIDDPRELSTWSNEHGYLSRRRRRDFSLSRPIELPMGHLATLVDAAPAVLSVKYIDVDGVQRTLDPSLYTVDNVTAPGRILPAFGQTWPLTRDQWDALRVQYVVGWRLDAPTPDLAPAVIPEALKQAVLLLISQMYEHRTPEVLGVMPASMKFSFDALVAPYRLNRVG